MSEHDRLLAEAAEFHVWGKNAQTTERKSYSPSRATVSVDAADAYLSIIPGTSGHTYSRRSTSPARSQSPGLTWKASDLTGSASVAVDVDGDGRADYLVTGADRDGDGIPDALQVKTPFSVHDAQRVIYCVCAAHLCCFNVCR